MNNFKHPLNCVACTRLADHLSQLRQAHPDWHCLPVPALGDIEAELLVVGLGPGERGANRTGRPFTGDVAGELLYPALHRFGFATVPNPLGEDKWANPAMVLHNARVTNAVRCLPPANKPVMAEIHQCNGFLKSEMAAMPRLKAVIALGTIAHDSILRAFDQKPKQYKFGHNVRHDLPAGKPVLFDSYHCSGYNWRTGRITRESFEAVFERVKEFLGTA